MENTEEKKQVIMICSPDETQALREKLEAKGYEAIDPYTQECGVTFGEVEEDKQYLDLLPLILEHGSVTVSDTGEILKIGLGDDIVH